MVRGSQSRINGFLTGQGFGEDGGIMGAEPKLVE